MDERLTLNVAAARFGPRMRYYSLDHRRLFCFFVAGCRTIRVRIRTEGPAMAATVCAMANCTRIRRAFDNATWRRRWELEHIHSEQRNAIDAICPQVIDVMLRENVARAKLLPKRDLRPGWSCSSATAEFLTTTSLECVCCLRQPFEPTTDRTHHQCRIIPRTSSNVPLLPPAERHVVIPMEWLAGKRTVSLSHSECHPDRQQADAGQRSSEDNNDQCHPGRQRIRCRAEGGR